MEENKNKNCGSCVHFNDGHCRKSGEDVGFFDENACFESHDGATVTTKKCKGCGRDLPIESFGKHNRTPDGLQPLCKDCMSERLKQGHRKTKDQKPEAPKPEAPKPAKPAPVKPAPAERTTLAAYSDREIYDELLRRGWTGPLTRTETLN
jgi:hypothetical protein